MPARQRRDDRAEYERLKAKFERPARRPRPEPEPDGDDEDDGQIIMLTGRRASTFLSQMFGSDDQDQDDDDEDEDDDDDEDQDDGDPPPPSRNRFFGGRGSRG